MTGRNVSSQYNTVRDIQEGHYAHFDNDGVDDDDDNYDGCYSSPNYQNISSKTVVIRRALRYN